MRLTSLLRRSVALTATTALVSGGLAAGFAAPAFAAGSVTGFNPTQWDNRSTVRMHIDGSGFPVPANPLNGVQVVFSPVPGELDTPHEVAPFSVEADPGSTPTDVDVAVPLAMAPPGHYTIQVAAHDGTNPSAPSTATFWVYSYGGANASSVAFGSNPSGDQVSCALITNCLDRSIAGTTPLDIKGSNIAIGATARFLKLDGVTVDDGLSFLQHNPNNDKNKLDTQDADNVDGTGYASSTLLQGNYSYAPDEGLLPGFTPGLHKLQVVNSDGNTTGTRTDFAQPWFAADKDVSIAPDGIGVGAKNRVITLTGQGIRSGSKLGIESRATGGLTPCAGVTVGASTVSNPDPAHPGTFTTLSAPVSMADCTTDDLTSRAVTVIGPDGGRFTRGGFLDIVTNPTVSALSAGYEELGQGARVGFDQSEDVNITGTNFEGVGESDTAKMTSFDAGPGVTITTLAVTSGSNAKVSITVAPDAPVGDRSITVTNPDGGSSTKSGDYLPSGDPDPSGDPAPLIINAGPKVSKVQPTSFDSSDTKAVTITGTFRTADTYDVKVCDHLATAVDSPVCTPSANISAGAPTDTATTLSLSISTNNAAGGLRDLLVTDSTDNGRYYCYGCIGIDSMTVAYPGGTNTNTNDSFLLTVNGTGIGSAGTGATATLTRLVALSGQGPISLKTGTQLASTGADSAQGLFNLTDVAPGAYSVTVVKDANTSWSCTGCLTITGAHITTPTIDRVPSDGSVNSTTGAGQGATGVVVTVPGTNFSKGMQVAIPDVHVYDLVVNTATDTLTFKVDVPAAGSPESSTGDKTVTITAGDGSGTAPGTGTGSKTTNLHFVVAAPPAPTGTTSPASYGQGAGSADYLAANGGTPLTISVEGEQGTFQSGAQLSLGPDIEVTDEVVTPGDPPVLDPILQTVIIPGTPDTISGKIAVAETAATGKRTASVTNPDGGSGSVADAFTVNQGPKITSVANETGQPVLKPDGTAHLITILGSGFATGGDTSKVLDVLPGDGITYGTITVVDAGKITAQITAATDAVKGARKVGVTNDSTDHGFGSKTPVYVALAPGVPGSLKAVGGASSLILSWTKPAENGAPITGYHVTVLRGSTVVAQKDVAAPALSTTVSPLANDVTYTVRVQAVNAAGAGAPATTTGVAGRQTSLTRYSSARSGVAGSGITFSGRLAWGSTGLGGKKITLYIHPAVGSTFTRYTYTTSTGTWSYRYYPQYTFNLDQVAFAGDNVYRKVVVTTDLVIPVASRVTVTSPANYARSSSTTVLKIAGKVLPNKSGRYIYLQRYVSGSWRNVSRSTVSSTSTFLFTGKPGKGTYYFRVYIPATTGNTAGKSATLKLYRY